MSEQAREVKDTAIPDWADGLYYNKGLFSEALVYYDDSAVYFEVRGKDNGIVRLLRDARNARRGNRRGTGRTRRLVGVARAPNFGEDVALSW